MTAVRRHRARRGEGERLRDEIVTATTALLVENGTEESVSIRAIADRVGVTPPSIYLHFADKDELMLAVCQNRFEHLDALSNAAAAGAATPFEALRKRGEAYVRFGLDNPEQYRILFMLKSAHASPDQVAGWAALQHMVDTVQQCIDAGEINSGDPLLITLGLWAVVHGLTSLLISMPGFPWPPVDQLIDHALDTIGFGLVPR